MAVIFCAARAQPPDTVRRVFEKQQFYPNGKLEVAGLAFVTKYFGEFTDQYVGFSAGVMTRYALPFLPEIALGVRTSTGWLEYERRYKARFGDGFLRQFPPADFPDAMTKGVMRRTKFTAFEPLLFLNLFPRSTVNYYVFGGYTVMPYYPQDIEEDPIDAGGIKIHYPDYKEKNTVTFYWTGGMGFDVFLSRRLTLGAQAAFRYIRTDMLDGYGHIDDFGLQTNPDNFIEAGVKLGYYLFETADTDRDGISDADEEKLGTNPYNDDTDGDGIGDYDEITLYKADPLKTDTDGDGISDYDEIVVYHTDPSASDTDADGLSDIDEALVYTTNPRLPDSDGDGIADRDEIARGTNPMNADSDADDTPDGRDECPLTPGKAEFRGCPAPPPAPVKSDTVMIMRRDTVIITRTDTVYVARAEIALPKEVVTIRKGQSFTVYGINFQSGSAVIEPESYPVLDTVVLWLRQNPDISTEVRGHTDSVGKATANMALSNDRAEAVIEYLVRAGIVRLRLTAAGYGESIPVGDNGTPEGRALNRRIEFYVRNK